MEPEERERLAAAARAGSAEAFSQLLQEHKLQLYKMAYRYLGNEADALEALQETACRVYRRIGKLKESAYFATWLFRILINYCLDESRAKKRRERLRRHSAVEETGLLNSSAPDHEARRLEQMILLDEVKRLGPPYQTVIQLKYYHDWTITEIARTLQKPEGTIKTWLNKALKSLRIRMEEEGEYRG